jgi:acyl-coenzyme A synthetase/AMP-(fatty) acid ligase
MTEEEVKAYLQDKLPSTNPEYIEFMKDFPRNPTGKILKQDLKKLLVKRVDTVFCRFTTKRRR